MKNKSFLFRRIFDRVVQKKKNQKQRNKRQFLALMLEMVAHSVFGGVATTILGSFLGFTAFGGMFLDIYSNLAPPTEASGEVTLLTVGPEALYMWNSENPEPETTPRDLLAKLIDILDEAGARTIVLDVLLDGHTDNDELLMHAAQKHGSVIGAEQSIVNQPRTGRLFAKGISPTLQNADHTAIYPAQANLFFTEPLLFTGDMIFRGVHLVQFYQRSTIYGTWPETIVGAKEEVISPALCLSGAWLHNARKADPDTPYSKLLHELKEGCSIVEGSVQCVSTEVSYLPTFQTELHQDFWLHHMGSERNDALPFLPASTLLMLAAENETFKQLGIPADQLPPTQFPESVSDLLKDKLVVVGRVDRMHTELSDRYPTTYSFPLFKHQDMAGVRIQAQLMDALLAGRKIQFLPLWIQLCLIGGAFWMTILLYRKVDILWQLPLWLLCFLTMLFLGYSLFVWGDGWVLELGPMTTVSMLTLIWLYTRYEWMDDTDSSNFDETKSPTLLESTTLEKS